MGDGEGERRYDAAVHEDMCVFIIIYVIDHETAETFKRKRK
jgi:hypothetical protein